MDESPRFAHMFRKSIGKRSYEDVKWRLSIQIQMIFQLS